MHPISPIHFYLETTFFSQELESAYATTSFLNFRSTSDAEVITIAYNKTIVIGSARLSYPPPFTNWSTGSLAFVRIGKRVVCAIQWCTPRGASRISYSSHDKRLHMDTRHALHYMVYIHAWPSIMSSASAPQRFGVLRFAPPTSGNVSDSIPAQSQK